MEDSLALLKRDGLLKDWSDHQILPGQKISEKIKNKMNEANIIVFLLSKNFISSKWCMEEWAHAKSLTDEGKPIFRIPIIIRDCTWKMLLANDDIKALPNDGESVTSYPDADSAWTEVCEGIAKVVDKLQNTFTPKSEFVREMEQTEFLSQQHIKLQDIYIFLLLRCYDQQPKSSGILGEELIEDEEVLLRRKNILIHGEDMSGKTALTRYLFLYLSEKPMPVLHIDLDSVPQTFSENIFFDAYKTQFNGDYTVWKKQKDKTLILDNLTSSAKSISTVASAKEFFDRIIVTTSSDIFNSFFIDEKILIDFHVMAIEPMTHIQQEQLIIKRLELLDENQPITDVFVDKVENKVNSIITASKIVPRYPFFVLSILQTYEGFMPKNLSVTSYGYCYYVLVVASLVKSGISRKDAMIDTCFNFSEKWAFKIYENSKKHGEHKLDIDDFFVEYNKNFIIEKSLMNRLKDVNYGIITEDGKFRAPYMYHFFLGRHFSKNGNKHEEEIEKMCEKIYVTSNYLTLLFIIHHTKDEKIIDNVLVRTMCTLDTVEPAKLTKDETKRFKDILLSMRKNRLSQNSVSSERKTERGIRDASENQPEVAHDPHETNDGDPVNDCYRILKNNEITGQILRNKFGSIKMAKIEEIIEIIADSGLRLVNLILKDEDEITAFSNYIQEKHPDHDSRKVETLVRWFSFIWTMINVEKIVSAINIPEIQEIVEKVVNKKSTPAYNLIGYFYRLDSEPELSNSIRNELVTLIKNNDDLFFKKVLSIRTWHYMNTHRGKASIEQSICSKLGIEYSPKKNLPRLKNQQ